MVLRSDSRRSQLEEDIRSGRKLTRREFVARGGLLALALGTAGPLLASCGGDSSPASPTQSSASSPAAGEGDAPASGPLVIAGWGGRFTEATRQYLVEPFMAETGIQVEIVDAPGEQVARLVAQRDAGKIQWDLVDAIGAAEGYTAFHKGLFAKMPDDVRGRIEPHVNLVNDYGFAYSSLAFTITCNREAAETYPTTPQEFWDTEKFPGPRVLPGLAPLQTLTFAMLADGVSPDQLFPLDLDRAFAKLEEIKPHVAVWFTSGDQMEQVLRDEEVIMGLAWSGRAYRLTDEGVPLEIIWDQAIYDPGFWVVVEGAPHPDLAWQFMEWVAMNAEGQAKWATEMGYGIANPKAFDHMDEVAAKRLADYPDNFEKLVIPDWDWYATHRDEVERRFTEFLAG